MKYEKKINDQNRKRLRGLVTLVLLILMLFPLSFCSKKGNDDSSETIYYDVHITYNATYPEVSTYYGNGDATLHDYGDHATISGTISVGQLSFDAEFEGDLNGDQFVLVTTNFQVQYELNGVTYTEDITINFAAFTIWGDTVTATGDYTAVTNPGATTESGTVTFVATKKDNPKITTITDI
jgi:hypothetical protein